MESKRDVDKFIRSNSNCAERRCASDTGLMFTYDDDDDEEGGEGSLLCKADIFLRCVLLLLLL